MANLRYGHHSGSVGAKKDNRSEMKMESKRLGLYPRKRIDKGLADTGFIEGPTVKIEYRWANGDYDKWRCDCRHARRAEPLISGTATSVPDPSEHRSDVCFLG